LISSVQFLIGNLQKIRGVSIWPKDKEKEVRDRIQKEIKEVDDGNVFDIQMDLESGFISIYQNPETYMNRRH